jgi:hypothetical protein
MSRQGHHTQWAAQFAVASELCKRGYEVAFTAGNHPMIDLMVVSPGGKPFVVDVKGLYRKNPWPIGRKQLRDDLFYVLVYLPKDEPNQFFVVSHAQVEALIRAQLKRLGRDDKYPVTGFNWKEALPHEDAWHILPK